MQGFNHVAGGFAFTGIFCSFAEVNIFDRFDTMAVVWVAAVLPDIDHTKSLIGKAALPLAKWLSAKYGHRTITHSLVFVVSVVAIVKGFDNLFHQSFTLPVALALSSHIIFDMCTKQGVPVFYPFSRKPAVLPANPKLRLSANDFRSEAILFVLFCSLNMFSYPLMASGFWTKYNQQFNTWDHFDREQKRKAGDYRARFLNSRGDTISGIVVSSGAEVVIWSSGKFSRWKPDQTRLIDFTRLSSRHTLETVNVLQIGIDSLNKFMKMQVVKITAQSENEIYFFKGSLMEKATQLTEDYPNGARFAMLATDNRATEYKLKMLVAKYNDEKRQFAAEVEKSVQLRSRLTEERRKTGLSDFEEGERRDLIKKLEAEVNAFVLPMLPSVEIYHVERAMLEMQLRETAKINATILIWQVNENRN